MSWLKRIHRRWRAIVLHAVLLETTELSGGCQCTGWDGCPSPSACGTPYGCYCGA
jgi:hypothetical protein